MNEFPDTCPVCGHAIESKFIDAFSDSVSSYDGFLQAIFRCPRNQCRRLFFAHYTGSRLMGHSVLQLARVAVLVKFKNEEFSEIIQNISERFLSIYHQAETAEQNGLDEICGPGYRKALEFLVKDYLIKQDPSQESIVKKQHLGTAIKAIKDAHIQEMAKRAAWLGNDETHYERRWTDKDLSHLKDLISLVVNWIENAEKTQQYINDMPDGKIGGQVTAPVP